MTILAGKIGEEISQLGLFTHKKDDSGKKMTIDSLGVSKTFNTQKYAKELPKMIEVFLKENFDKSRYEDIYGACFGIEGPVKNNEQAEISRENFKATFNVREFRQKLPYKTVPGAFINDMEAIGYGIFLGDGEDGLEELYSGKQQALLQDRRALMLVSKGLGQALWYWNEKKKRFSPISSEAGHADFAPRTEKEIALFYYLKKEEPDRPISYEQVLSSPGLVRICKFLQSTGEYENQHPNNADAIIQKAVQGDSLCKEALKMFISIWGAEAGNMALRYKAEGGIYIGGISIPIEILREDDTFLNAFTYKERSFKTYNEGISVKVFKEQDDEEQALVMWGAARYALEEGFVGEGKFAIKREQM
ncbi:MAG: glucokinase [Okeania sp. SIO2H7]|nr:glucokinase [Okeania sp. SIO2H7]